MNRKQARRIADQYCCLDLINAEGQGVVATATGGVWIGGGSDPGCLSGYPKANFCPFCGAEIVVEPPNEVRSGWAWYTKAPR